MRDVNIYIKNRQGFFDSVDIEDFEYRLNRVAFSVESDKLKSLGGDFSTQIRLSGTKRNRRIFVGKSDIKSVGRFNFSGDYEAYITEDGAEVARGVFRLESVGTTFDGTFYDSGIDWLSLISDISLNRLGYTERGVPTWLVPFNGVETFNEVNDKSNRETDIVFPTVCYNNTNISDYLDYSDAQIWGGSLSFPEDFRAEPAFLGPRMGLRYSDFPPAVYYRNIIERIFEQAGIAVECSLFNDLAFNAKCLLYAGSGYSYNWKNIASVYSETPSTYQLGESNFDGVYESTSYDDLSVNIAALPALTNAPRRFWITPGTESFTFQISNIIKNDDINTSVDKVGLTNTFEDSGQYICPADGKYTIRVSSQIRKEYGGYINIYDGFNNTNPIWLGGSLLNSFGTHDATYDSNSPDDCHFGRDDQVLIVLRKSESGRVSPQTTRNLLRWMNGESKDFESEESDVIAYLSPKRFEINKTTPIPQASYMGTPLSGFTEQIRLDESQGVPIVEHGTLVAQSGELEVRTRASFSVDAELSKGEIVEIFWISLSNINGEVNFSPNQPKPYSDAVTRTSVNQWLGNGAFPQGLFNCQYSIEYQEGEYDLDVAQNLPDISARQFIESFIKEYNLHFRFYNNTIYLIPFSRFYSKNYYDVTPRVLFSKSDADAWRAYPISTPREWVVGYTNDENDRLLNLEKQGFKEYANLIFLNDNTYSKDIADDRTLFSASRFVLANCQLSRPSGGLSFPTSTEPNTGSQLIKGVAYSDIHQVNNYYIPSTQSKDSYNSRSRGENEKTFEHSPRVLYHLGTINKYIGISDDYQLFCDLPRASAPWISRQKHWFRPTVSQFDGENFGLCGIKYQSLRYDTEEGLFNAYFENLIELYNKSDILKLKISLRASDWKALDGSRRVVFQDQVYRLMKISDYDPKGGEPATIELMREI